MTNAVGYQDLSRTSTVLSFALGIYALMGLVGLWSNWLQVDMLLQVPIGDQVATSVAAANDLRQGRVGQLTFIAFLATAILFLRWTYLASRNTQFLTTAKRQHSPGWAVGWYFIPVASLWKPYQAMKEAFRASDPAYADDWSQSRVPQVVAIWWLIWVVWNATIIYVTGRSSRAETLEELLAASQLALASNAVDVALGLVGILLVYNLSTRQREKHRHVVAPAI